MESAHFFLLRITITVQLPVSAIIFQTEITNQLLLPCIVCVSYCTLNNPIVFRSYSLCWVSKKCATYLLPVLNAVLQIILPLYSSAMLCDHWAVAWDKNHDANESAFSCESALALFLSCTCRMLMLLLELLYRLVGFWSGKKKHS